MTTIGERIKNTTLSPLAKAILQELGKDGEEFTDYYFPMLEELFPDAGHKQIGECLEELEKTYLVMFCVWSPDLEHTVWRITSLGLDWLHDREVESLRDVPFAPGRRKRVSPLAQRTKSLSERTAL